MTAKTSTTDPRLFKRLCVMCGYDGTLLRAGQATRCARCGGDLRRRPARSYAEMEGMVGYPADREATTPMGPRYEQRLIYRWLAFLFLAMLGFVVLVYLSAVAMSV